MPAACLVNTGYKANATRRPHPELICALRGKNCVTGISKQECSRMLRSDPARRPAAKLNSPAASFAKPPGIMEYARSPNCRHRHRWLHRIRCLSCSHRRRSYYKDHWRYCESRQKQWKRYYRLCFGSSAYHCISIAGNISRTSADRSIDIGGAVNCASADRCPPAAGEVMIASPTVASGPLARFSVPPPTVE